LAFNASSRPFAVVLAAALPDFAAYQVRVRA
jgi:hypothetical protein